MAHTHCHTTAQKRGHEQAQNNQPERFPEYQVRTSHTLLHLQRAAGNQAVIRLLGTNQHGVAQHQPIQRCTACSAKLQQSEKEECASCHQKRLGDMQRVPEAEDALLQRKVGDGHDLKSPRFAKDATLEACLDGEQRLKTGDTGESVGKVQQALIDAGHPLPKFGVDNKFFGETATAVHEFKQKRGISPSDGVVGPKTMAALDALSSDGPKPDPNPKPNPNPDPDPNPTPKPPAPTPQHEGCSADIDATISPALTSAQSALASAISALSERPLAPHTQDALWLALRVTTESDAATVVGLLRQVQQGLPGAEIVCNDGGFFCPEGVNARGNTLTKTIHVCTKFWGAANSTLRERALIHEGLHIFAGATGLGEKSHGDECDESDVVGQSRAFRMQNADSLACAVILLTDPGQQSLGGKVRHSKGEDLALRQRPKGDIALSAAPQSTTFEMVGFSDVGIQGTRWIFQDREGRKYLLRAENGDTIVAPDEAIPLISGLFLGAKTRALLQKRGITDADLTAVSNIPEVGQKVIQLAIRLIP